MELEKIYSLIDKAEKSSFNKIEIKTQDVKISLERGGAAAPAAMPEAVQPKADAQTPAPADEPSKENTVFAPISGVFYTAKEPGAAPFISEGGKVRKGDTICIIEAMKTMNEISAPKKGVISRILKEDSEPVTAGDALFTYAEG